VDGDGSNQLRFDDTTGQISTQLHSSHGATQLNLGNLSHPKEKAESDGRGEGFELRTDQWGAVRAGDGLLLSTYKQSQATGEQLNANEAKSQLNSSEQSAQALNDAAKHQKTDEVELLSNLKQFAEQIQCDIAKFNQNIMLLTSPSGIGLTTPSNIHFSADGQINNIAKDSLNLSTQNNLIAHAKNKLSLFAATDDMKLITGKGKIDIQAQNNLMDLIARKEIQIISTEDMIYIIASKGIKLIGGSSLIQIDNAGISSKTGGKFESKAGQHVFESGAKVEANTPNLPPEPIVKTNKNFS